VKNVEEKHIKCLNCGETLDLEYTKRCSGCGWVNSLGATPFDLEAYPPLQKEKWTGAETHYCFPPIDAKYLRILKKKAPKMFDAFSKFLQDDHLTYDDHQRLNTLKRNEYLRAKCEALRYIVEHEEDSRRKVTVDMITHMKNLKRDGHTLEQIARKLDVSIATVSNYLAEWDLESSNSDPDPDSDSDLDRSH
jgi:hypothetical protein